MEPFFGVEVFIDTIKHSLNHAFVLTLLHDLLALLQLYLGARSILLACESFLLYWLLSLHTGRFHTLIILELLEITFFFSLLSRGFFLSCAFELIFFGRGAQAIIQIWKVIANVQRLLAVVALNDLFCVTLHGVGLSSTCWTIDEDCAILAIKEGMA